MQKPPFQKAMLHPKYWGIWFGVGLAASLSFLPYKVQLSIGKGLGILLHKVLKSRRRVAEVNIRLCFPELSADEQAQLVRENFINTATGFMETMIAWFRHPHYLLDKTEFRGLDKIAAAQKSGKGVLLLGAHYTMLDLVGTLTCNYVEANITYKRQHNLVLNWIMEACRARTYKIMFISKDIRGVVAALNNKEVVWYAPDQDFGFKNTVFAPFFGVQAATLTTTTHLASAGNAVVLPLTYFRKNDNSGYLIEFHDALPIPSGDVVQDATIANACLEQQIRRFPSQYLWLHQRFKSQPGQENNRGAIYKKK
ncbi:MAG: hypothetical protein RL217_1212 [Pseudomonadota bacterium]|jgi:KDO2-lipid IV(A) lauroyltransferase